MSFFEILSRADSSWARTGVLKTAHGFVETPAYAAVGTDGKIRTLDPKDIPLSKTQVIIANTYHLFLQLKEQLSDFPGLHRVLGWNGPVMTDSGGFQVFSLGFGREHQVGKIISIFPAETNHGIKKEFKADLGRLRPEKNLVRITEEGVFFEEEGKTLFLSPELSIAVQEKLDSDIVLAFDECTSPLHNYEYTKESLLRTHRWEERCLKAKKRNHQLIFGIVQGGAFQDLRETNARFIGALPFDGFAIGGSLGKSKAEMLKVLEWTIPLLPEEKPRHLLGIGRIEDIFSAVDLGIDIFDCVIPTREARHGAIWTEDGRFDITKSIYEKDSKILVSGCACRVCGEEKFSRKQIWEFFKTKNPEGARLATIHNLYFFNNLMTEIRKAIQSRRLPELKKNISARLKRPFAK